MHPCASHGLCRYTNNNTIIEVKLNTNTPMNTSTHSNSDIRTSIHTDIMNGDFGSNAKLKSNTNTNVPSNTNYHVSISINAVEKLRRPSPL